MENNQVNTNDKSYRRNYCADVKTQVQPLTEQCPVDPVVIEAGDAVVKLPVVLAEVKVIIPVEATIKLDEYAMEIKRIKKNVYLTQCRIIPHSKGCNPSTGILYVSGFIRKNIEYATKGNCYHGSPNVCGDIKHCTVKVPFSFTTIITFDRLPIFNRNKTPREIEFFTDELKGCDVCADPVIGGNPCDSSSFFTEYFNEKPFTELVKADIAEVDINQVYEGSEHNCGDPTEQKFTKLTEKVVVNLTLKVLQKQQVRIFAQ